MATNVQSTELDFNSIKTKLKEYLQAKPEFQDYDFEGSGLSNILDVLSYNTHFNALLANFALNEAFLETAQLRSSVVTHALSLGYYPRSRTASSAFLQLTLNLTDLPVRPPVIELPAGLTFNASTEEGTFTFRTLQSYFATEDNGFYTFIDSLGNPYVQVFEGVSRTKTFYVNEPEENQVYVITDPNIDTTTAEVRVYPDRNSSNYDTYTTITTAITIEEDSKYYVLKEAPNGYYELQFGDGISTGIAPVTGNKIEIEYLSVAGTAANGAKTFTANTGYSIGGYTFPFNIVVINQSAAGAEKQSIESIRQLAPLNFTTQNRLVTSEDYRSLILRNYNQYIEDAVAWGGQDNVPPEFGKAFISLKFPDGTNNITKNLIQDNIRENLTDSLSVMSITPEFVEPQITYLICETNIYYNPNLTSVTGNTFQTRVKELIETYFEENLGLFNSIFRKSRLLDAIDESDDAILSSKMDMKMQIRFSPIIGSTVIPVNQVISFPNPIAEPDNVSYKVTSSRFVFNNTICEFRNKLGSTSIELVDVTGNIVVDNIGSYTPTNGKVSLSLEGAISEIVGGGSEIKVNTIPANGAVLRPLRNYILEFGSDESYVIANIDYQSTRVSL